MVISDYNNVLIVADRIDGCHVQIAEYVDLKDMTNVGLFEHATQESHHTWVNKHKNRKIYSRIDRVVCN